MASILLTMSISACSCDDDNEGNPVVTPSNTTTGTTGSDEDDLLEIVQGRDDLSSLADSVVQAGLDGALADTGPLTVFAPDNSAFASLDADVAMMLSDLEFLTLVLQYHVVEGRLTSTSLSNGQTLTTLAVDAAGLPLELTVTVQGGQVAINGIAVKEADIEASNGIVHILDGVLEPEAAPSLGTIPEVLQEEGRFGTLLAAVNAAGLADTLSGAGPFTLFAPNDSAFNMLLAELNISSEELLAQENLADILRYHVISGALPSDSLANGQSLTMLNGEDVTVAVEGNTVVLNGTVRIVTADLAASNGTIHELDAVLVRDIGPQLGTIPEVLEDDEGNRFTTLLDAVTTAGLADTLSSPGPFTLFAPTNGAFRDLPEGTLDGLTPEQLRDILLDHVVSGSTLAESLSDGQTIETEAGNTLTITIDEDSNVFINDTIQIIETDILASNGVIHVIDAVLLPPPPPLGTIPEVLTADGRFGTLLTAVTTAELADTLSGDGPFTLFAPTDDAFAALLEALEIDADALLARDDLADILLYHVVEGQTLAADLSDGQTITTVLGEDITITISNDGVFINGTIQIIETDILAKEAHRCVSASPGPL
ncbi:MAG: fasciclin domain-containing protein [Myxococcota bacterium]